MRILFVHSGADMYGASRSLLRLTTRLAQDANAVKVVLPYDGPLREALERQGIEVDLENGLSIVTRRMFRTPLGLLKFVLNVPLSTCKLWFKAREFRPDLIHTNTALIIPPGIVSRLMFIPHVWHVREFFSEFPWFLRVYQWFMLTFSDVIICVSGPVASQFHPLVRKKRIVVVHNGIPKDELTKPDDTRVDKFRNTYGLNGQLLVGVVGRIKMGRKGQDVFVKAAALLHDKYPGAKFICIGSPFPGNDNHLRHLVDQVNRAGLTPQFVYTGDVPDVQAAYAALDVSVLPSVLPEPFGGVVLESMAMGKPVVGTRIGGTVEQIEDGVTGLLVEPGNENSLAEALDKLLADADLRQRMGENARQRFLSEFEMTAFYERILSIYKKVCMRLAANT